MFPVAYTGCFKNTITNIEDEFLAPKQEQIRVYVRKSVLSEVLQELNYQLLHTKYYLI